MPLWLKLAYALGKDLTLRIALAYAVLMKFALFALAEPGNAAIFWGYTIFYGIAFYGAIPNEAFISLLIGNYLIKIALSLIDTPFVYLLVKWARRHPDGA